MHRRADHAGSTNIRILSICGFFAYEDIRINCLQYAFFSVRQIWIYAHINRNAYALMEKNPYGRSGAQSLDDFVGLKKLFGITLNNSTEDTILSSQAMQRF